MLQQVLRDMYIDPELLAGLAEKDKQTLFCCMREEQIRRWRLWDQKESEVMKNQRVRSKCKSKSVQWALDNMGEPRVEIIDYQYDETDCAEKETNKDDTNNKEYEQKELRLSVKDGRCIDLNGNSNDTVNKMSKYVDVSVTNKTTSSASIVINFNEKRGALQELSLNKVPKVARQVAEWEKRVTKDGESKPAAKITAIKSTEDTKNTKDTIIETEQEQLWREQQKKAKEVEIRMRTIARLAREEHRRSLIENSDENFQSSLIQDNAFELCKNISKPPSKEALLDWFHAKEIPKKAVLEKDSSIAEWFHGFISWQEAENILNEEKCGTFLVRICERVWGYAISYKDAVNVKHYLIDASSGHYKVLGTDHISHKTLGDLISYYKIKPLTSNNEEILKFPCLRSKDPSAVLIKSES